MAAACDAPPGAIISQGTRSVPRRAGRRGHQPRTTVRRRIRRGGKGYRALQVARRRRGGLLNGAISTWHARFVRGTRRGCTRGTRARMGSAYPARVRRAPESRTAGTSFIRRSRLGTATPERGKHPSKNRRQFDTSRERIIRRRDSERRPGLGSKGSRMRIDHREDEIDPGSYVVGTKLPAAMGGSRL